MQDVKVEGIATQDLQLLLERIPCRPVLRGKRSQAQKLHTAAAL
jgi:hypothetical protein